MADAPTKTAVPLTCWSCSALAESPLFCPACRRIQPLPPGTDYFSLFDLPRKLRIDPAGLEQRFHQLSWKLHPDNFVQATDFERYLSLERSSVLNDAYRTLRDPISRVEYLLGQENMRKEGQSKQQAPPELLEEVFELNESLDELRAARQPGGDGEEMAALRKRLEGAEKLFGEKLAEVDGELDRAFGEWDAAVEANAGADERAKLMARMNDILNRRSYIRNLVANVQKELAEA
jgi:molecular chaperone HscB